MTHPIIGLVGRSGAGKSTLILEILARCPERVTIIPSLTSRPRRGEDDKRFYHFVSRENILQRQRDGRLLQLAEYAGHLYATDRKEVDRLLADRIGMNAVVEPAVADFRRAGYTITIVKIIPEHAEQTQDVARRTADEERTGTELAADLIIVNSFLPGGKEKAVEELMRFINGLSLM